MNLSLTKKGEIFENTEGKLLFICCICDAINLTLADVENHLKTHISTVLMNSDVDDDTDTGYKIPVHHIKESTKLNEEKSEIDKLPKKDNISKNDSELTLSCNYCPERFPCSGLRDQHIASIHKYSMSPFICCKCKSGFADERFYMGHMAAHKKPFNIDCPGCGHITSTINDLVKHLEGKDSYIYDIIRVREDIKRSKAATVHREKPDGSTTVYHVFHPDHYKCDVCGRILSSKHNMKDHLFTHLKEKPYKCHICGHGFTKIPTLQAHVRRLHDNEKPYQCHQCTKSFCTTTDLNIHVRSHTGERKYVCSFCGHRSSTSSNLSRHTRAIHSLEKNNKCDYEGCGKHFFARASLMRHLRMHTGEMPYTCNLCNRRFSWMKNLKRHAKRLHPVVG